MVYLEIHGDNDFASIFPSVAEERRDAEERRQTQLFMRLIEELESNQQPKNENIVEHLRVNSKGDIIHDENQLKAVERSKVHTLEDLPKESEFDFLFGPKPEPEPQIKVQTGLRLQDKKEVHRAIFPSLENFSLNWSGFSFDTLLIISLGLFLLGMFIFKLSKRSKNKVESNNDETQKQFELKVQKEVQNQLQLQQLQAQIQHLQFLLEYKK